MSQTQIPFYDRCGVRVTPQAHSVIRPRSGVWTIAQAADSLLVLWPAAARGVPDLPGGGIEDGETTQQALVREWGEETGLPFTPDAGPFASHHQLRGFYAENSDEFWVYDQTFFLYTFTRRHEIGQRWRNPEGNEVEWMALKDVAAARLNRAHWLGVEALLPEITNTGKY